MKSSFILEKFQRLSSLQHFLLGLVIVFIVSFFSEGFYHPDEHYVLLEWVDLIGHWTSRPEITATFEFKEGIRPWIQVGIFFILQKVFNLIGMGSPFLIAFFLRVITGIMGLWVLINLSKKVDHYLKETWVSPNKIHPKWFHFYWGAILTAYTLFFLVRPSADVWGLYFFFMGSSFWFSPKLTQKNLIFICFFWTLSLLVRYQLIIFMVPFYFYWLGKYKVIGELWLKNKIKLYIIPISIGISLLFFEGFINYLVTGKWYYNSFNHLWLNVVKGYSHQFGKLPLWGYFSLLIKHPLVILNILVIYCFWNQWKNARGSLVSLTTFFYFLFFSILGHKEIRFLMPLIFLSPFVVLNIFYHFSKSFQKKFIILNLICFGALNFSTAHTPMKIYKSLYKSEWNYFKKNNSVLPVYLFDANIDREKPFELLLRFYRKKPFLIDTKLNSDPREIPLEASQLTNWKNLPNEFNLITDKSHQMAFIRENVPQCHMINSTYAPWILDSFIFRLFSKSSAWGHYHCLRK
jgi:phosphatidylinositol glycan class B